MIEKKIARIAEHFRVPASDLPTRNRHRLVILARQVSFYILRQQTDLTLEQVGHFLGNRSPATVTHGYQKIARDIEKSQVFRREIQSLMDAVNILN